jgi:anti-anti-sigma factor
MGSRRGRLVRLDSDMARDGIGGWSAVMDERPTFEVVESRRGDDRLLRLRGELDIAWVGDLTDALDRAAGPQVVVDLSGLSFVDSSGAAALVRATQAAESAGRRLALVRPSPPVARVFELLGLASVIDEGGD